MTFELAHEFFRAIANFTYDWETWVGPDGSVRWVNPAVERITGYTPRQCQAMRDYPLPLVDDTDRDKVREALAGAAAGTTGNDLEFRIRHRDGGLRWAAVSWQPLVGETGTPLGYRTSVRDISARKATEERLRVALRQAEEAERARTALLANVSHELRTPIHNLIGYATLLGRTELSDEQSAWRSIISNQAEVLRVLVDDLLDLASGEAGGPRSEPRPFDLHATVATTVEAQRVAIEKKGLALAVDIRLDNREITGDAKATAQILRNLLDNARKYTDHGEIAVTVGRDSAGERVSLTIRDTGIGMDPKHVSELRQPFRRADDSRTRRQEGVGLGLAIVDRLCRRLDGQMEIQSAIDAGTTVRVWLPAKLATTAGPADRVSLSMLDVLVVDDLEVGRMLAVELLRDLGCRRVDVAKNAREALASCDVRPYHVVLMDLHMPDLDGVAAAHLIRARAHNRHPMPRIIAMTADIFSQDVALEAFDGYLGKPVDERALLASLACAQQQHDDPAPALDPRRVRELREARTRSGDSFFQRFGAPTRKQLLALGADLEQHTANNALDTLARLTHDIKGAADLIGARGLASLAATVQRQLEAADQGCNQLKPSITRVVETLNRELD